MDEKWSGDGWSVRVSDGGVLLTAGEETAVPAVEASHLRVRRRWLRWQLEGGALPPVRLRGLRRNDARALAQTLAQLGVRSAVEWHADVCATFQQAHAEQRWISTETVAHLIHSRPSPDLITRVEAAGVRGMLSEGETAAVGMLLVDLEATVRGCNDQIMVAELAAQRPFFDTIEKSPLTEEQARAVVCFDNRVQVLAAAGSGKTSVMVARAAYAVYRGFVPADRILLLAFNKAAAAELETRVGARFTAAGIDPAGLRASTFHSFGLDVIGQATGAKPRLARWLDNGGELSMVMQIVDQLRDASESFRYNWDLYRLVFSKSPTELKKGEAKGDDDLAPDKFATLRSGVVKSVGEQMIADFLFLNGVDYEYERRYDVPLATPTKSQYRPDFYYPAVGAWHEHWAVGLDGKPPANFAGYGESMTWKRNLHAQHGTKLIETTWGEVVVAGTGLAKLAADLIQLGIELDWNPHRHIPNQYAKPMKDEDLARFVRTFMCHVKSNSWTREDLERRLTSDMSRLNVHRTRLFLEIYWQIHDEWEKRLAEDGSVDFEDMLVKAADHLEAGRAEFPYELIMVDEFQDASRARAKFVRGLLKRPGRYLLAVGDDWQSINRFAGADVSVMTGFESWFGRGQQLALTTTFRCTQTICDVARHFVSKNPSQFDKPMRSVHADPGPAIQVVRDDNTARAISQCLERLSAAVEAGDVPTGPDGTMSVDILGRYRFLRSDVPKRAWPHLRVTFRTVHSSKGLEADYVIVPGLGSGTYGFPSEVDDDPVLDLALPTPEGYEHAEERRLLYVALTRARRQVTLIGPARSSAFVRELTKDGKVEVVDEYGDEVIVCRGSRCEEGTMVRRTGPYGPFLGCSTYPRCKQTQKL